MIDAVSHDGRPRLLAVLLNPPATTTGIRTMKAVERAGRVLGFEQVRLANLSAAATASVVELSAAGSTEGWADARESLRQGLHEADAILAGWGVSGLTGPARRSRDEQVQWLHAEALAAGHTHLWMVGGEPRHPSRWHQYLADKHGRTLGGSFDQRLSQAIRRVPITEHRTSGTAVPVSRDVLAAAPKLVSGQVELPQTLAQGNG